MVFVLQSGWVWVDAKLHDFYTIYNVGNRRK
jgi:hypothetical protein